MLLVKQAFKSLPMVQRHCATLPGYQIAALAFTVLLKKNPKERSSLKVMTSYRVAVYSTEVQTFRFFSV